MEDLGPLNGPEQLELEHVTQEALREAAEDREAVGVLG
jgi:hypothetical protein